jgi:hypothetical protein
VLKNRNRQALEASDGVRQPNRRLGNTYEGQYRVMRKSKFWQSLTSLFAAIALTLAGVNQAKAVVTSNISIPIDLFVFIPCADGGAGELVELTGPLHIVMAFTADSSGGFHVVTHFQPQGISGVGLTTGLKYNATGETDETLNVTAGVTDTIVNNFKIIGQGPGNNSLLHENFHITINANGTATASVDNFNSSCK